MRKETLPISILNPKKVLAIELAELHLLDEKLEKLSKRLNLTARLRPVNYFAELDRFISEKGNYNPVFDYKFPSLTLQGKRNDELQAFREQLEKSYLKSQLLSLFKEKAEELDHRAKLLKAYTEQDFATIEKENIALFGDFDPELLKISKEKLFSSDHNTKKIGKILTFSEVREYIEKYLTTQGIFGIEINESSSSFSRMTVSMGKIIRINIAKNVSFTEQELRALMAHEVDTHLTRYLNGLKS